MKLFFSLLSILVLSKECNQQKQAVENASTEQSISTEQSSERQSIENKMTISYEASTRGFYEKVWVTKDAITVTNDRSAKDTKTYACPEKDWNELMEAIASIKLEHLAQLDVPSKAFQHDGAAMASLKVQDNDVIFSSPIFDHGNPPKSLATVVKKVLYLKEMVEKQ